jgi:hypothetical protein
MEKWACWLSQLAKLAKLARNHKPFLEEHIFDHYYGKSTMPFHFIENLVKVAA